MNISIYVNPAKKDSCEIIKKLLLVGKKYNINFLFLKEMAMIKEFKNLVVCKEEYITKCKYAIVIGGDGTFISAAHLFVDKKVPLLGINTGNFGFLTEVKNNEVEENLFGLVHNKIKIEERLILDVRLKRNGKILYGLLAINEAVVCKGGLTKIIKLRTCCDNRYIGTFSGDGVMVSTPTGSTGYSLSATGPIIYPVMDLFILNTICPHTLVFRPIIIPASSIVTIENINSLDNIILTIDGFKGINLKKDDKIIIKKYKNNLKLITSPDRNFFDILREKFNWVE